MTALNPSGRRALQFGLLYALVGLAVGAYAVHSAIGDGWDLLPICATLAAFLTGISLWYWLIERRAATHGHAGIRTGILTGALAGILAHYLCWYLLILCANLDYLWFGTTSSLGEPPMNPIQALAGAAVFSGFSLFLFGWVTIPAGALLGLLMIRLTRVLPT
ncbi:hypothetical protein Thiowin_03535 [Thiorhodovibrio winogradskyi]|uniref:DUF4199 domain-containing protein n=1 Tax=Thiorhodovibrio winogradskyi TaxID=77007 RepID=A0ABZ0SED0_9GAMM|nr:hypothetical protein [Thiorhodovibrio winogradskyi]